MDENNLYDEGLDLSLGNQNTIRITPNHGEDHRRLSKPGPAEPSLKLGFSDEAFSGGVGGCGLARQSSTLTTLSSPSNASPSGVKRERSEEAEVEKTSSKCGDAAADDAEDDGGARKKLRLTKEQSALLENKFKEHSTLNPKQKQALAKHLNLQPRQVEVWFQNRRARTKLKQTEVDLEILKKYCEKLTDQNRRLKKELHELRALKIVVRPPPPAYIQLPATAVTVCPCCKRIAGAGSS